MRNMSFAFTTDQIRKQTKTVTRRPGWMFLKPGDLLQPVEKGMGLKKGEKVKKVGPPIQILSIQNEPLYLVDDTDAKKEGYEVALQFTRAWREHNPKHRDLKQYVNRIEFEYTGPPEGKE